MHTKLKWKMNKPNNLHVNFHAYLSIFKMDGRQCDRFFLSVFGK